MDYALFRLCDRDRIDTLEAHVLARAYIDAWRAFYLYEPFGEHTIDSLELAIDFGPGARRLSTEILDMPDVNEALEEFARSRQSEGVACERE